MSSATRREFYNRAASEPRSVRPVASRVLFVLALLFVALLSLLYVRETSDLASAGYDVAELQTQESDWTMRNEQLKLQLDQLTSLDRVEQIASTKLGLGPPRRVVYVAASAVTLPPVPPLTPSPTPTPFDTPLGALFRAAARVP